VGKHGIVFRKLENKREKLAHDGEIGPLKKCLKWAISDFNGINHTFLNVLINTVVLNY
jgi:hypothetical protein